PSCHYMKPAGVYVCPKCGFKPLAGENVQVDETRELKKLKAGEQIFTKEQKQSWWSQIKFYQKQREISGKPISDGWCAHTYKKKFGVWPRGLHDTPQEITPEVSNYIRSKNIAFAKMQAKKNTKEVKPKTEAEKIASARSHLEDIREKLSLGGNREDGRGSNRSMA
ncbi:TPA: ATP-dependent helicase, partial [Proteus mirabilis]